MIWIGILLILFSGLKLITFACNVPKYVCGINVDYCFFIPMFLIAAGMTVFRPFQKHEKGSNFGITGIIVGVLLFFISMLYNVLISIDMMVSSVKQFNFNSNYICYQTAICSIHFSYSSGCKLFKKIHFHFITISSTFHSGHYLYSFKIQSIFFYSG